MAPSVRFWQLCKINTPHWMIYILTRALWCLPAFLSWIKPNIEGHNRVYAYHNDNETSSDHWWERTTTLVISQVSNYVFVYKRKSSVKL